MKVSALFLPVEDAIVRAMTPAEVFVWMDALDDHEGEAPPRKNPFTRLFAGLRGFFLE